MEGRSARMSPRVFGVVVVLFGAVAGSTAAASSQRSFGRLTITYQANNGTEQYIGPTAGPGTCGTISSVSASAHVQWKTAWDRITLPSRARALNVARAAPRLNGSWTEDYPNYCKPGTVIVCQAAIKGNGRPAKLSIARAGSYYRMTLQAMPANGTRVARYENGGRCKPKLRYQAFEAVASFRVARVHRMEREHPDGFTITTRVSVTDPGRSGVKKGAPHYSCGSACHDDVNWSGNVILTYTPR